MNYKEIILSAIESFNNYRANGGLKVTKEVKDSRLQVCNSCDRLYKSFSVCGECKCFMLVKATLPDSSCPLGLWDKSEQTEKSSTDIPVDFNCGSCGK